MTIHQACRDSGHFTQTYKVVRTQEGTVVLLICDKCSSIEAHCEHEKCTWNENETELRCNLCGVDAT